MIPKLTMKTLQMLQYNAARLRRQDDIETNGLYYVRVGNRFSHKMSSSEASRLQSRLESAGIEAEVQYAGQSGTNC